MMKILISDHDLLVGTSNYSESMNNNYIILAQSDVNSEHETPSTDVNHGDVNDGHNNAENHSDEDSLHAVTEAAHGNDEHGGSFPPFDSTTFPSQIFWLVICFVVLYVFLSRVGLPRISGIIEARKHKLTSDIDSAELLREEGKRAKESYEAELAKARQNAKSLANTARDEARAQAETERKKAENEIAQKMVEAESAINSKKAEVLSHLETIAADTAKEIHKALLGSDPADGKLKSALNKALKG